MLAPTHCTACGAPTSADGKAVDLRTALEEALAYLQWDGVPHLIPGEMQHRSNLAVYTIRAALNHVQ